MLATLPTALTQSAMVGVWCVLLLGISYLMRPR
jgi:hypothetical protein